MSVVKRQHYVWRYYLKQWTTDNKIWCKRNDNLFHSALMGVAQEKYFYEVEDLSDAEFCFLESLALHEAGDVLGAVLGEYLKIFRSPVLIQRHLRENGITDPDQWELHRQAKINSIESLHSIIEGSRLKSWRVCISKILGSIPMINYVAD